jgi:hypothetical protein
MCISISFPASSFLVFCHIFFVCSLCLCFFEVELYAQITTLFTLRALRLYVFKFMHVGFVALDVVFFNHHHAELTLS